jgi:uncharacterized protein (TIGR00297 family)
MQFLVGIGFALLISAIAYFLHALDISGMIAASFLGAIVFGFGGLPWAVLLVLFFVTSSALSYLSTRKNPIRLGDFKKPLQRNAWQVLANGGAAGMFVILHAILPARPWTWVGFAASLATANADTWSTEIGMLSHKKPVSIATGKFVKTGESGGITLIGSVGGSLGSAIIALACGLFWPKDLASPFNNYVLISILLVAFIGILGAFIDSLLGATLQARFFCTVCKVSSEHHPFHHCGSPTVFQKGWNWLNNDWVNGISTAISGILITGVLSLIQSVIH